MLWISRGILGRGSSAYRSHRRILIERLLVEGTGCTTGFILLFGVA